MNDKSSPLHQLHRSLGARFAPFAGFSLPLRFPNGTLAEHAHTRRAASLFDVSHMGQADLNASPEILETIFPSDILNLSPKHARYTLLLNQEAGICDDLIISRLSEQNRFRLVVNAACAENDFKRIADLLKGEGALSPRPDLALIALQGPRAAHCLADLDPDIPAMHFMTLRQTSLAGIPCLVSRSGYTGEDGFEISLPSSSAPILAANLLKNPEVLPAGLGARDTLRLEAGLCLYGSDIDETTSPAEAGLLWTIPKRRRQEKNFPGALALNRILADGLSRKRIGLRLEGKRPARAGASILHRKTGHTLGIVTSAGVAPTQATPFAMGYLPPDKTQNAEPLDLLIRETRLPARLAPLPFLPHRYHRPHSQGDSA